MKQNRTGVAGVLVIATLLAAGCSSGGSGDTRPDVMNLKDQPMPAHTSTTTPPPMDAGPMPAPPAPEPPVSVSAGPRHHIVAAKETLYSIAKQYYGDSKQWTKIRDANPGLVPEKMPVGKSIIIP